MSIWDRIPLMPPPTPPAAGADFNYTIPAGRQGRVEGLIFTIATSATAAARYLHVEIGEHGIFIPYRTSNTFDVQFQNTTNVYSIGRGLPLSSAASQLFRTAPMSDPVILEAGDYIGTILFTKQAGDQITPDWRYKERSI